MKSIEDISRKRSAEPRGARTRSEILQVAVQLASREGLESLTIGRLAEELGLSKSGLFGHFGSKEDLQLAVVGTARDIFNQEVIEPAFTRDPGLPRLVAIAEEWISYLKRDVFKGGCFFMASSIEFDDRNGKIRDHIFELLNSWRETLVNEVNQAQKLGHLKQSVNRGQLIFEIHGLVQHANWSHKLFRDPGAFARAQTAIHERLKQAATRKGLGLIPRKAASRAKPKKR